MLHAGLTTYKEKGTHMKFWATYGITLDGVLTGVRLFPTRKKAWKSAKKTMKAILAEYEDGMTLKEGKNAGIYQTNPADGTITYKNMVYIVKPVKLKEKDVIRKMAQKDGRDNIFEVAKMLTLSTGHISKDTAGMIAHECESKPDRSAAFPVCYEKGPYGFVIYISPDYDPKNTDIPSDLAKCINIAALLGCTWLCLDRDGPISEQLPVYEW